MRKLTVAPLLLTLKQPRGSRVKREELTPKQSRFVDEYLKDLNATEAIRWRMSRDNISIAGAIDELVIAGYRALRSMKG
jgi:hypothetical protein